MKRRRFIAGLGSGAALAACAPETQEQIGSNSTQRFSWKLVTTWLPNFPGLGTGVNTLARYIEELSAGRITVRVYAAGELVPAFEVFDAVQQGTAEMGHGAAYYWRGKTEAAQFFAAIPFGLNAHEMNAWLYYGGGLDLWREVYEPFNLMPFPCGNTGCQMGGWFNRPIESMEDWIGLKMRIPGIGGEVLRREGAIPTAIPLGEIFLALQTGVIDATEWVSPYNDRALNLQDVARYYYYPGWQEPGPTLECIVNMDAWNSLPPDLQAIVRVACQATNLDMISEFMARNPIALEQLAADESVEIRAFPDNVLAALKAKTFEVVEELAAEYPDVARVWRSYQDFMRRSQPWQEISEQAILATKQL
ncbi:MAG: ABC transporter substrate-binding protein [Gammaproteobacteria bacterium]